MISSLYHLSENYIRHFYERTGELIHIIDHSAPDMDSLIQTDILIAMDRDFASILPFCPSLRLGLVIGAGVDRLDFKALIERNISLANAGSISADAMSDYVMGALLMFSSQLFHCIINQQKAYWEPYLYTRPLRGQKLLVVGAGKIGSQIAQKAQAFGMYVEGISRSGRPNSAFDHVYSMKMLDDCLPEADYVVCVLPLTDETRLLFDDEKFCKMKPSAVFINIARGALCDQDALLRALQQGKIAGAALDVFSPEPLPEQHQLWQMKNVLITPHSSGRLANYAEHTCEIFARNVLAWRDGEKLITPVDLYKQY